MKQSAFTIVTPVDGRRLDDLERLLEEIGGDLAGNRHLRFADLQGLHFASLVIVPAGTGDAHLLFEGNVDGPVGAFLEQLLEKAGTGVQAVYRHCTGYPTSGGTAALRYLRGHDIGADTFYVNRPGRTVADIRQEQLLREHLQRLVDERGEALRTLAPDVARQAIATSLPDELGWARSPATAPFLVRHSIDLKIVLLLVLAPPALGLLGLARVAFGRSTARRRAVVSRAALVAVVGLAARAVQLLRRAEDADERADGERATDWQAAYAASTGSEERLGAREDLGVQNHMVSVTRIKDGWLRFAALRLVLWVVNLIARATATKGTLGGIPSIHFARWVVLPDRSLLFLSNFDGSWESYLNDFIDLAAGGLTAVWSNTANDVGFPATRWLLQGGARQADRFKCYARSSMVPTCVWWSAYPELSASNIGNNMQLRAGLSARPDLTASEAWLRRL